MNDPSRPRPLCTGGGAVVRVAHGGPGFGTQHQTRASEAETNGNRANRGWLDAAQRRRRHCVFPSAVGSVDQHESGGGAEAITAVVGLTIVFSAIPAVVLGTLLLLWGLAARAKS
jgi:hypothetical protein